MKFNVFSNSFSLPPLALTVALTLSGTCWSLAAESALAKSKSTETAKSGVAKESAKAAVHTQDDIEDKLKKARLAEIDKKYQVALDDYLWVFEHSRKVAKWKGVRNAMVSQELVKLAGEFEPAKAEVLKLRDDREKLMLEEKASEADVQDWAILNHNLHDDRRSISIYKQLSAKGAPWAQICDWIEECIPVTLVRGRQYQDLLPWAERASAQQIATVEESESKGFTGRLALPLVMEDVYACYEVLLADGKEAQAAKLAETILRPWSSHDMFSAFVRAARRTNHKEVADELLALAKKKVSATDYELILGEIKPENRTEK